MHPSIPASPATFSQAEAPLSGGAELCISPPCKVENHPFRPNASAAAVWLACSRVASTLQGCQATHSSLPLTVDRRIPGKEDSNCHGAGPVHLIITIYSGFGPVGSSIKNSLYFLAHRLRKRDTVILQVRRIFPIFVRAIGVLIKWHHCSHPRARTTHIRSVSFQKQKKI